jgi:hypothetical protein
MHVKIKGNRNFHHDSSTIASKRCRCRYRYGQNGYACLPPLLGHRRDAPSIPSPYSITDTPEIPPRPITNIYADTNAKHARRYGHGHAAPLCWTPQTTARSVPSPPHSPSTHLSTLERGDTSFLYIARVRVRHRQSKC